MVSLKNSARTLQQTSRPDENTAVNAPDQDMRETRLPSREFIPSPQTFLALNQDPRIPQTFHPHLKVHTSHGEDALSLSQAAIPYASPQYRLRSDYLAQTLQIFARKVQDILPEGYSVQISLSPFGGHASTDIIHLIRLGPDGPAQSILERHYAPFDGGSLSGIIPSDQARNVILKIEERLFYYTTFLAVQKALENESHRQLHDVGALRVPPTNRPKTKKS